MSTFRKYFVKMLPGRRTRKQRRKWRVSGMRGSAGARQEGREGLEEDPTWNHGSPPPAVSKQSGCLNRITISHDRKQGLAAWALIPDAVAIAIAVDAAPRAVLETLDAESSIHCCSHTCWSSAQVPWSSRCASSSTTSPGKSSWQQPPCPDLASTTGTTALRTTPAWRTRLLGLGRLGLEFGLS